MPVPPAMLSAPAPPFNVSLPVPPINVSLPVPPTMLWENSLPVSVRPVVAVAVRISISELAASV